eukprot:TRINITY_DN9877_c0_g1_i1.p1 TRINITY_DN9877_c0_g1~~TRINITY_DN9877_c0_g1_i1.p1  ORF type:complete len:176 (+),score=22.31 TRINITY_DN9877_c0_g1_i1:51-578(+)
MSDKKGKKKPTEPPAPKAVARGYWRGPLAVPGRKPVSLEAYRQAATRNCRIKHRDQARDQWILRRNRHNQLAAGYTPFDNVALPQEYLPAPVVIPQVEQPAVPQITYHQPVQQVVQPAYSATPVFTQAPAVVEPQAVYPPVLSQTTTPVYAPATALPAAAPVSYGAYPATAIPAF